MEIINQEHDILKWPIDKLLNKIETIKSTIKKKLDVFTIQIVENIIKSLKELQGIQKYKDDRRIFLKVYRRYKDLYEFFLTDSSNLMTQFYRILCFMHIMVDLTETIDSDRVFACERAMSKSCYYPSDEKELLSFYEEEEDRIISSINIKIIDDRIRVSSGHYEKRTKVPLKLDEKLPWSLKNKYFLSPDNYLYRKREKIKKLPEFFAKIFLEDENRVKYEDFLKLDVIHSLDLSSLKLSFIPKEIRLISSLRELNLRFNRLKTLPESLRELKSLERLDLRNNPLESYPESIHILLARGVRVEFPKGAQLEELEEERLIELAKKINEEKLSPEYFVICNGVICFTKNKKTLDLYDKGITNITSIYGLNKIDGLTELDLSKNKIKRIKGLEKHKTLKRLYLSRNEIEQITELDRLVNLEYLNLSRNRITKIEGLDSLILLKSLYLGDNLISNMEGLNGLKNLNFLDLKNNREIKDLRGLEDLVNLESLVLDNNRITELKGLDTLVNLKRLSLRKSSSGFSIIEVKGLEHLIKLKKFDNSFYSNIGRVRRSKFGRLRKEFGTDGRLWVNYCREMVGLEKLKVKTKRVRRRDYFHPF